MIKVTVDNSSYPVATCELPGKYAILGGYLTDHYPIKSAPTLRNHLAVVRAIIEGHIHQARGDSNTVWGDKNRYWYRMNISQQSTTMKLKTESGRCYKYSNHLSIKTTMLLSIMSKWYNVIRPYAEVNND